MIAALVFMTNCSLRQTEIFSQSSVAADGITTAVALQDPHLYEANPLMPKTSVGALMFTTAVMIANHYVGNALEKKWPGAGKVWFIGFGISKGYASIHNILIMGDHYERYHTDPLVNCHK